jgi:hypothetical protein
MMIRIIKASFEIKGFTATSPLVPIFHPGDAGLMGLEGPSSLFKDQVSKNTIGITV